jgi:putative Mg2+ transporter-C (MgtC) family protein
MDFPLIDWRQVGANLLSVCVAYLLALPVAWDREQHARTAGLRTFPLVAVASCGYVLLATSVFGRGGGEAEARIVQGLITGVGFIGGGAILKHGATVRGTATAASVWNTGAIGACAAYQRYEIAVVLSLINFLTLRFLTELKKDEAEGAGAGRGAGAGGDAGSGTGV